MAEWFAAVLVSARKPGEVYDVKIPIDNDVIFGLECVALKNDSDVIGFTTASRGPRRQ